MTTHYFQREDGRIAYDDEGEGPVILCLPAGGDLRSEYRFLKPRLLAAGYRVITMDLRGQGESSAFWPDYRPASVGDDALALLHHLKIDAGTIVATSVGTAAAVWAAVESPALVTGLVLISAAGRALPPTQARLMPLIFLNPLWGRFAYRWYFPRMYPSSRPPDFEIHLQAVSAMLAEAGRLRALRHLFADSYRDWDERVERVQAPVLILNGSLDPDFKNPVQEAHILAGRMQSGAVNVQIIQGAGHHPQAEMPELTARYMLDFLAAHQPKTRRIQEAL
jgi:pimeloyl-ACP methyl ester carboxylesterase